MSALNTGVIVKWSKGIVAGLGMHCNRWQNNKYQVQKCLNDQY